MNILVRHARRLGLCLLVLPLIASASEQALFDTPEAAVGAMAALIGNADAAQVEAVFGAGSTELFASGDAAGDRRDFARVKQLIEEKVAFDAYDENTRVVLLGAGGWPWPIPLVREHAKWRFDTESGRQELLNRRIGADELWTLTALREVVEAQQEYRAMAVDGAPAFARRFRSTDGKRDGLWWPVAEGEDTSPLGDLLAESEITAAADAFHGYHYRILEAQGPGAPGGERSYLDAQGRMSLGFAVLAWPAKYGNSGVMSFLVNQQGIVFQKDLGAQTGTLAEAITRFDIDTSWEPTADAVEDDDAVSEAQGPADH